MMEYFCERSYFVKKLFSPITGLQGKGKAIPPALQTFRHWREITGESSIQHIVSDRTGAGNTHQATRSLYMECNTRLK